MITAKEAAELTDISWEFDNVPGEMRTAMLVEIESLIRYEALYWSQSEVLISDHSSHNDTWHRMFNDALDAADVEYIMARLVESGYSVSFNDQAKSVRISWNQPEARIEEEVDD